jgi:hypothetical protein
MAYVTPQLNLTEWNAATDPYNHVQLATNWSVIDTQLLKKTWTLNGDEATLVKFFGTANVAFLMASASGNAYPYYTIYGNGSVTWGPGSAVADTNLYRSAIGTARTDNSFSIGKNLTVAGTAGVFGAFVSGSSTASSLNVTGNASALSLTVGNNAVVLGSANVGNGLGVTGNINSSGTIQAGNGTFTTLNVNQLNAGLVVGNSTATNLQGNQLTIQGSPGNASITNGLTVGFINNSSGGITNTGSLAGVTTISASGAVSTGALTSTSHNNSNGGITNAGAISGVTTINSHTVSGNLTISGGSISGATTVNGATLSGGTLSGGNVSGGTHTATQVNGVTVGTTGISGVASGGISVTGNSTITGTLGGLTGLTVAGTGASISGGLNLNTSSINGVTTLSTSGAINGATISGGTLSGGNVSGGTLTGTQVNGVNLTTSGISGITNLTVTGAANLGPNSIFTAPVETVSIVTSQIGSGATIALNTATSGFFLYNNVSGPAGTYTINITGPSANLATGQSITVAFAVLNGSNAAYYPTTYQIEGTTAGVNVYWGNASPPAAANTTTYDVYTFSVIKTAASTYTVFAQQSKF